MSIAVVLKPPATYAEWSELLGMLKNKTNDEVVLAAMKQGIIAWQAGVSERFAKKLTDTINARMNDATDKFQKDIARTRGQDGAIVQALLTLRKELVFLNDAMDLPAIPENDRVQYCALVQNQAGKIQESLENSAQKDRTGKMSNLVRNHKVNIF